MVLKRIACKPTHISYFFSRNLKDVARLRVKLRRADFALLNYSWFTRRSFSEVWRRRRESTCNTVFVQIYDKEYRHYPPVIIQLLYAPAT